MDEPNLTGQPWNDAEVEATLDTYFEMLRLELEGHEYVKSEFRERLLPRLSGRSKKAIELKFCNVSAVLTELDLPWIDGYAPMSNYQRKLKPAVQAYVERHPSLKILWSD